MSRRVTRKWKVRRGKGGQEKFDVGREGERRVGGEHEKKK
jgi:hypothetical protein